MSLMPTGMPSIADSGLPARHRRVDRSAAVRAVSKLICTKARISGSQSASVSRQRSKNPRGESDPDAKATVASTNGAGRGVREELMKPLEPSTRYRRLTAQILETNGFLSSCPGCQYRIVQLVTLKAPPAKLHQHEANKRAHGERHHEICDCST